MKACAPRMLGRASRATKGALPDQGSAARVIRRLGSSHRDAGIGVSGTALPGRSERKRGSIAARGRLFCAVTATRFLALTGDGVAAAEPGLRFVARYSSSFLNIPVGQADLTADLMGDKYAINLNGGLSCLSGWFFQGSGSAHSQGRFSANGTVLGWFSDRRPLRCDAGPGACRPRVRDRPQGRG